MSVEAVDLRLAEWDERLARIDESLLALEAEPTYQMLAPRSLPRAPLEGETARVVGPALDALGEVFEQRGRLTEVLDRARAVRAGMDGAFWGNDEREREIAALLDGPSVALPPRVTPLSRRTLLDPAAEEVRAAPAQVLAAMAGAFERARDAVVAVQRAWETVDPALRRMERQLEDARASAASLGVEAVVAGELGAIEGELGAARVRVARDPLGTSGEVVGRLSPRVGALAAELGATAAQRGRVEQGLVRARELLAEVRVVRGRAAAAVVAFPEEVEGGRAPGMATDEGLVEGLAPWLGKIGEAAARGRWAAAEVGLQKWTEAARAYVANDGPIAAAFEAVLGRREELAGRLSARRAQAAARGVVVGADAEAAAREAEGLLARRPARLARVTELVERYERAVTGRGGGGRG